MKLQKGDAGTLVVMLQTALRSNTIFAAAPLDGIFGDQTEFAVTSFQTANSLPADGIAGARTLRALGLNLSAYVPNGSNNLIDWILPASGKGFQSYNREAGGRDQFGTKETIAKIKDIARQFAEKYPFECRLQFGDLSRRHGGAFPPHRTHTNGCAVDMRPIRRDNAMLPCDCRNKRDYDDLSTANFARLFKKMFPRGKVLFNDKELIKAGLVIFAPGHYNHLHLILD